VVLAKGRHANTAARTAQDRKTVWSGKRSIAAERTDDGIGVGLAPLNA